MPVLPERAHGLAPYAELYCITNFSFLRGASHPEEYVDQADTLRYGALAITDECSLAGVVRAHSETKRKASKLPLLIGSFFRLADAPGGDTLTLIVLAQNIEGYGNLCEFITLGRQRAEKGHYRLSCKDLTEPPPDDRHLRHLPDCLLILVPQYGADPQTLVEQARWLAGIGAGRAWVGLTQLYRPDDERHRCDVQHAAQHAGLPVVALGQAEMHVRSRKSVHDTLTAIRLGRPLQDCGYELAASAEQHLRTRLRLQQLFTPAMLAQTIEIARRCHFTLDEIKYLYPEEVVPPGMTPDAYLRQETLAGARARYPAGVPDHVARQIEHELELIQRLKYPAYFLTVYDIVKYARTRGILCQGRGSAANSAVCYCLHITEVDPRRGNGLFERFISANRNEPPDIDVDFEHQRREEVIQYIYGKYGRARAALTAVVISYRPRSVLRDTGKALGMDAALIDHVAKQHQWWDGKHALLQTFEQAQVATDSMAVRHWIELAATLMGFPRHLSQHPGGFVMARGKLSRLVPIENAAMAERSVVQWDKDDLDAAGLLKVDILALGMLSVLNRAFKLVSLRRNIEFKAQDIPIDDTATFEMISRADTVGVFQIESRAQMTMLVRLRPREYYDLVIEVAIVRPGPIQGGMVHPYLRRRQGTERVEYPSPAIQSVLQRTLGVPIFQEQVMRIAMVAADFSGAEADSLRRAMAAWKRKGGIEHFRSKLVDGMLKNGYTQEFAEAIFRQMEGFGEYGFPESHAASFALLAYQSAWIKCHEPEAFLAALLNSQPMGFYSPSQLIQDAQRNGAVTVLPIDVQTSAYESTLVEESNARPSVRLGLNLVKGLQQTSGERIERARQSGAFASLADLARRAGLDRRALDALAGADALHSLSGHRRQARWDAAISAAPDGLLRDTWRPDSEAPDLVESTEGQAIIEDYQSTGLTLRRHPLALLRPVLQARRFEPAAQLQAYPSRRLARACGIVTMRQRPGTAKGTVFVTLEDETGIINVIVRASLGERQRHALLKSTLLGVYGIWQNEQNVRHLIAERLVDLSSYLGELAPASRNFH